MIFLRTKLSEVSGIGEKTQIKLKKLGLETIQDFLFYYPFRYENFGSPKKINELILREKVIFLGRVDIVESKRSFSKRRNFTKAIIKDDTGRIEIIWFNNKWVKDSLKQGELYYFVGEVSANSYGNIEMINPSFEKYKIQKNNEVIYPIYRTTKTLKQSVFRNLAKKIFSYKIDSEEDIPEYILKKYNFLAINEAIKNIHTPEEVFLLEKAIERIKFDELFLFQLLNKLSKEKLRNKKGFKIEFREKETKEFIKSLGFDLTEKQKKVSWQIIKDIEKENPSNRLLEGDVGSGKTIVFLISMLSVLLNKYQACIMVPTSILANQHYNKILSLFKKYNFNIALFTGSSVLLNNEKIKKTDLIEKISSGNIDLVIGTHTLIQDNIKFKNLAFVVIDEQHRFGVEQRKRIISNFEFVNQNKLFPHFLSVTATPIPRTLALAFYGDLDVSILDEKPLNRKDIKTSIIQDLNEVYKFIKDEINSGRQAYIICPLIEETETENSFELEIKSAKKTFEDINKLEIFKNAKIGLLHGKLKSKEKDEVEDKFFKNEINILVSTSVVEVGIDVQNASTILILGSERFGLAQLYQLRGRVGRSDIQSYCFLQTNSKQEKTFNRLNSLIVAKNSFELAEMDMKERGVGEIYGLKQSGKIPDLKLASLYDVKLIKIAQDEANEIMMNNKLKNFKELENRLLEKQADIHYE